MRISSAFASKHLKSSDLNGREVRVIMESVRVEELGVDKDKKPVLYFEGKEKGLVLNKVNATTIADYYGDDTSAWAGQPIILYETEVEYQGKRRPGIRVKVNPNHTPRGSMSAPPAAREQERPASRYQDKVMDDDIPFSLLIICALSLPLMAAVIGGLAA